MIEIRGAGKGFGPVRVLEDVDLRVETGEFFCLLGPSGCGKTTLLRLVAGLEKPDAGSFHVAGRDVTAAPPHERGCAMVFQSYALWPHLTVAENITYGLEVARRPRDEVRRVLAEALESYHLEGLGERLPHQLSGGQQQRVALARAMAMKPRALLMDEPLSNLDASLRKALRRELLGFHRAAGNTILYVTHDQEEALALADRIGVMMGGRIVEVGAPRDLYERPGSLETALFLGDMNVFRGGRPEGGRIRFGGWSLAAPPAGAGPASVLCIRPEHVRLAPAGEAAPGEGMGPGREGNPEDTPLAGTVRFLEYMGTHATVGLDSPAGPVLARLSPAEARNFRAGGPVRIGMPEAHRLWYPEAGV